MEVRECTKENMENLKSHTPNKNIKQCGHCGKCFSFFLKCLISYYHKCPQLNFPIKIKMQIPSKFCVNTNRSTIHYHPSLKTLQMLTKLMITKIFILERWEGKRKELQKGRRCTASQVTRINWKACKRSERT